MHGLCFKGEVQIIGFGNRDTFGALDLQIDNIVPQMNMLGNLAYQNHFTTQEDFLKGSSE